LIVAAMRGNDADAQRLEMLDQVVLSLLPIFNYQ
jgi:hypothetical protein